MIIFCFLSREELTKFKYFYFPEQIVVINEMF